MVSAGRPPTWPAPHCLAAGASKRTAGVTDHPGGVADRLLGPGGQLGGPLGDLLASLVGAGAQRPGQLVRAAAGGLDAPDGACQRADRPDQ
jgi:hypothetical protein